ncbi:MAG: Large ribosomal subunit accumulation protein YceD [Fibrobacteres bacterium]|nr:Large ribosomal subunit accumulation protein YceD [Fibrobacterota bacterium]
MMDLAVRGSITLDCGRCLDKLTGAFAVKLRLLVEKKDSQGLEWEEDEGLGIEEYLVKIGPDIQEIPLEHLIAEQIILNYNLNPLPSLDEKDRCIQCNRQAFQAEAVRRDKDKVDPRWQKLQALKKPELDKPDADKPDQAKPKGP